MPGLDENPKFNKNELVWAKVRGHAWWPGRVGNVQMELLPRMKRPEYTYEVHFLEDESHSKLVAKNVMTFYENFHKLAFTTKTKKRATKAICKAIKCHLKQKGYFDIEADVRQKFELLWEEKCTLKKEQKKNGWGTRKKKKGRKFSGKGIEEEINLDSPLYFFDGMTLPNCE